MTLDEFWEIIERSLQADPSCEGQAEALAETLEELAPEEIASFDRHFLERRIEACRWDLWAVATLVKGGCSDDGFEYFRCWLIGRGRKAFEAAMKDAARAADGVEPDEDPECEDLMYAAGEAYQARTGRELPPAGVEFPQEPRGEAWEEEALERLYPALWKRFGWSDLEP